MQHQLGPRVALLLVTLGFVGTGFVGRVGAGPGQIWPCLPGQVRVNATVCSNAIATVGSAYPGVGRSARPSLAIGSDGMPVLSYSDPAPWKSPMGSNWGVLRVTRCGNRACTSGNSSNDIRVLGDQNSGWHSSIAIGIYGWPIISSYEYYYSNLRVTACLTVSCDWNSQTRALATQGLGDIEVGRNTSIAVGVDGFPIISHERLSASQPGETSWLRVTHCTDAFCTAANTVTLWGAGTNQRTDIAIGSNGRALIAHVLRNGMPAVAHCTDIACSVASVAYLDASGIQADDPSVAIGTDGLPIVSYRAGAGELRVTHCGNGSCTAGNVTSTIMITRGVPYVGWYSSLAIAGDGLPVIAHYDRFAGNLLMTHCGNATCTSGDVTVTLDGSTHDVGAYPSLAIGVDGLPIVAYIDATNWTIRVAKCGTLACA